MKQRGRKSATNIEIAKGGKATLIKVTRLRAPAILTDAQAGVWRAVVADLRADWFSPRNAALLEVYCRHVVYARSLAELIERQMEKLFGLEAASPYDFGEVVAAREHLSSLTNMHRRETTAIGSLSGKMRLSQISQVSKDRNPDDPGGGEASRPWEGEE